MQNKVHLYIIGVFLLLVSCENSTENFIPILKTEATEYDISWLDGKWIDSTKFGYKNLYYHEIWEINEQNFLSCKKFTSTNGKESEPTKISLIKTENKYYYSYNFKNEQITYSSDSLAENYIRLICNLDKFPQKIEYIRSKDTLYISLAGMAGGVYRNPIYKTVKY